MNLIDIIYKSHVNILSKAELAYKQEADIQ